MNNQFNNLMGAADAGLNEEDMNVDIAAILDILPDEIREALQAAMIATSNHAEKLEILVNRPFPSATTFRFNKFKTKLIRFPFTLFFF